MKQWALWLPLLLAPIDGAWAINKCTNKDGTVAFQDAPCPREAEAKEIDIKVAPSTSRQNVDPRLPSLPSLARVSDQRVHRASRATTEVETLALKARDCRNHLSLAGKDRSDTCKRLAEQTEALLKPQVDTLRELSEDFEFRQKYRLYFDRGGVAARSAVIDTQAIKEMLSESTASAASASGKTLQPKKNDIRS